MSNNIYNRRSRKRMRRNKQRLQNGTLNKKKILFVILGFIFVVIIILFLTRNLWISSLEKAGIYLGDNKTFTIDADGVVVNNGETAQGNFPIMLSDSSDYQMDIMEENMVILSDTDFSVYSLDGELLDSRSHSYSNVVLETTGSRSLIYESGGKKFRVENQRKTIFEKTIEENIIFARISKEGYIAVITSSENYSCMLTIYDDKGNPVYYRGSVDRIIEVCFNNDSTGCRVTVMDASIGKIVSRAYEVDFTSENEKWTTSEFETLCINSYTTSDDGLFILGYTKCAYYDKNGIYLKGYSYKNTLTSGGFAGDKAAMIFENEERRKTSLVLSDGIGGVPKEYVIDANLKHLVVEPEFAYVLTDDEIRAYNYEGKLMARAEISDIYYSFLKSGNSIFLIGNSRIDKINFISN